ncbi:CubicO group peptidase, beta-lactamase class C family [Formosa sp. Hel1_31_208]|uniref:serine hydrolase domain-containing protein n=1 Tax=Formosa sp. Hel1_31_208 TaxID=1798225 RepID=UPI00087B65E0|nr:serine hydrolase domain-containing protein [Formosa sp. Hel1_31_208]SDS70222.1 CubicO group peptidase, beta-lactamase class C family [Formosa sp. Hel1_31_208]
MTLLKHLTLVCLFLACFFSCKNDTNDVLTADKKGEYAQFVNEMKTLGIHTGNILVYDNGEVVFKSAYGLRSIDPIDSLNLNSQFRLASVSKQFTGMAIMKLKEKGQLDYDQKVNSILSDFPYDNITVRHLLHHTSGVTDYERLIAENFVKEDPTKTYILGNDEILNTFYRVDPELDFQPGEKWEYSNTGYLVLATIVEKISGQHFRQFLKEQIFDPVGMTHTTLYKYQMDADPEMPNRVFGYQTALNQNEFIPNDYDIVNDVRGDGGIYSTLEDLYNWNMALANYTIISKDYLDEAWASGKTNDGEYTGYGFGWFLEYNPGEPKVVNHSGGWVGFGTFLHNEVDAKSGFILLTNNSTEYMRDIHNGITSIRQGEAYNLPKLHIKNELAEKIYAENVDAALRSYKMLKANSPENYDFSEVELNSLGYGLIRDNRLDDALQIFKFNTEQFPSSANPYDSYGDALLATGDTLRALENFRKCFAMDSTLTYAKDKSEALEAVFKN